MNTIAMPLVGVSQAERGAFAGTDERLLWCPEELLEPQSELELAAAVYTLIYALTSPAPQGDEFP